MAKTKEKTGIKNPVKEIVIEGVKPKKDSVYILDALPVGSGINGVMKAKPFTEYEKKNEEQELEEAKKCILTDNDILTDEQENEFREKFVSEKVSELMDAVNNIAKVYIPKENIDLSKKMDVAAMCDIVRRLFGIEKHPSMTEKIKKFSETCQKVAEECNGNKKEYTAPTCEVVNDAMKFIKLNGGIGEKSVDEGQEFVPGWFDGILDELKVLHAKKNSDYGNAAHESFKEFGLISYVIRLNDKMKRLKSLTKPGAEQQVADEKIEDTLMDLAAYAIMAIESLRIER